MLLAECRQKLPQSQTAELEARQNQQSEPERAEPKPPTFTPKVSAAQASSSKLQLGLKYNMRWERLAAALFSVLDADSNHRILILCYGKEGLGQAFLVRLESDGDVRDWEHIQKEYYDRRGYWRKWIPWWQVVAIKKAKVCY